MESNENKIIEILKDRLSSLTSYLVKDMKFRVFYGDPGKGAHKIAFNDSSWKIMKLPYLWNTEEEIWFRKKIIVPENIHGISIRDSTVEIGGSSCPDFVIIAHGEFYIDGQKIFEAQNWTDLRYRYKVCHAANPGDTHLIAFHFFKGNKYFDTYPRHLSPPVIHYSKLDEIIYDISLFIEELKFCMFLPGGEKILKKSIKDKDLEEIKSCSYSKIPVVLEEIRDRFKDLSISAKKYTVKLVGHAHIDMNWLWPMLETEEVVRDTFGTVLKLMNLYPDLHFSQSQAQTYKIAEDKYPEIFERMKDMAAKGRWDTTASTWVELDLNMSAGESIIRQILYGKKYIREKLGFNPRIFWAPDNFGHPWSMPQILKKSGIDYYYFMRASYKDDDLFWWQGIDGSRVLAFNSHYVGSIDMATIGELVKLADRTQNSKLSMYVYGIGDHGGGPTIADIETAKKINSKALLPKLEFSTTHDYFDRVSKEKNVKIPVWADEFNPLCDGCYTTHWDIKLRNRTCEKLLIEAETLGAVSKILGGKNTDLDKYWIATLFNQFHDILPGSGIKPAYDYSNKIAAGTESELASISGKILDEIKTSIKVKDKGIPVMVFNSLAWQRSGIASLELEPGISENTIVINHNGEIVPSQMHNGKLIFLAENIPSLGYSTFYSADNVGSQHSKLQDHNISVIKQDGKNGENDSYVMENEFFMQKIDKVSGLITYLYDKKNTRLVMKLRRDEGGGSSNAFPGKLKDHPDSNSGPLTMVTMNNLSQVLFESPHYMSAWVIGPISCIQNLLKPKVEIIAAGPLAAIIRVKHKFNNSIIIQDITMYHGIDRIDFNTTIDWNEKSDKDRDAPMLKAGFTPILGNTTARFEIPFGNIKRVADGREYPALKWVDLSDNDYGLSLLSDTKYGFDVKGNTIRITLIRTSYEPDPDPDRGKHSFTYSIYPHKGGFEKSDTVRKGYELTHKLMTAFLEKTGKGKFEEYKSFIKVDGDGVIMSAFKGATDGNGLIIRVYESKGKKARVRIEPGFRLKSAEEVNLLEESIDGKNVLCDNRLDFELAPFEIKTFRMELA